MQRWLDEDEEIRLEERPHPAALARPLARPLVLAAGGAVLVLLGGTLGFLVQALGAGALGLAALAALAVVWRWDRTSVVLTSEKLLVVGGTLRRSVATLPLARTSGIGVEQGVVGRLLGYGTIVAGDYEIPYVRRPRELTRLLR
jgi:hypothetical protein